MDIHAITGFFTSIPFDWIIIFVFFALVTFDAMRGGVTRAVALTLTLPITLLFLEWLPTTSYLAVFSKQFSGAVQAGVLAAVVFAILYLLINRMTDSFSVDTGHIIQAILAGAGLTAVTLVVWIQIPALDVAHHFGPQVQTIFGAAYRLWWLLGAYIALAYART